MRLLTTLLTGLAAALLLSPPAGAFETRATAAYVLDQTTGTVLLSKNPDMPLPPASMSKLMTLNMLFEALRDGRVTLDTQFSVSTKAKEMGGSTMFLDEQDRPRVEDLIKGIIVQSGNDACVVVAEGLAGTEEAFARLMTERAQALGMTQSATSAAVASLERLSGVKLFNRVGRGIELTEAGRRFLPEAKNVIERAAIARAILEQSAEIESGTVSIGASQTIANRWLPRRLAAFREAYPGIRLDVTIGNTQSVEDAVIRGDLDIGMVEGPTTHPALVRIIIDSDRPVLVTSPGTPVPLLSNGRIDLARLAWVVREEGSGTRDALLQLCERMNVSFDMLRIILILPSNEAVREAVEAGAGAAVISEQVVAASIEAERLSVVPVDLPQRDFVLLRHSQRTLTAAQRALVSSLGGRQ